MSVTRGVLAQFPEAEALDQVLDNNPDRIGIWKCWFLRRGDNPSTRRKTSRSKDENQQQIQLTYDAESGNRTRATLVVGKFSHHCAIPATLNWNTIIVFPPFWRTNRLLEEGNLLTNTP